ncbi:hypothetical protein YTPLAS18_29060 [Nitrospira sp.]|nr:hypothetical protein YTPLAS18_29060 [Nitrospira sp.]
MTPDNVRTFFRSLALACVGLSAVSCSFTETINDILSSTTPGDWYHDGMLREEYKAVAFARVNRENLLQDMARGNGEYLASMGELLGVPVSREQEFFAVAQQRSREIASAERQEPDAIVIALRQNWLVLRNNPIAGAAR